MVRLPPISRLPGRSVPPESLPSVAVPPIAIPGVRAETSSTTTEETTSTAAAAILAVRGSGRSFSPVDIANMALAQAGSTEQIAALSAGDDARTPLAARLCNLYWPLAFEAVARSHDWACLQKMADISANVTTSPVHTYTYAYVLPPDCLRVLGLTEDVAWTRSGWLLLTDTSTPYITYIRRTDDTSVFDSLFVQALVLQLAAFLTMALAQDETRKERLEAWLQRVCLPLARFVDSTEQSAPVFESTTFLEARR